MNFRCLSVFRAVIGGMLACLLVMMLSSQVFAEAWPEKKYNPNPMKDDLILPLPDGGKLVFRPVYVVQNNVAAAKRFIMGNENYSLIEYPQEGSISGAFQKGEGNWLYYLSKYEVTEGQYQAVMEGQVPKRISTIPRTDISWFEANRFCEKLSTWLLQNHKQALPAEDKASGFIRLPTEEEWEYACRGGAVVDANFFARESFIPDVDDPADYVQYYRVGDVETIQPIGLTRKPNPLGLFDMIGNAGEMCMDIFQLNNNFGRFGGFAVRGGTIRLSEYRIRSSCRQEYFFYDQRKNAPFQSGTIGFRVALTAPVFTSLQRKKQIDSEWQEVSLPKGGELKLTFDQARQKLARIATRISDPKLRKDLESIQNSYTAIAREMNNIERRDGESSLRIGAHLAGTIRLQMKKLGILENFLENLKKDEASNAAFIAKTETNLQKVRKSIESNLNSYGYAVESVAKKFQQYPKIVEEAFENVRQKMKLEKAESQIMTLEQMYTHVQQFRQRVPGKWREDLRTL